MPQSPILDPGRIEESDGLTSPVVPGSGTPRRDGEHPAVANLRACQRQLDFDGIEVGVSRQALDETLALHDELLEALQALAAQTSFAVGLMGDELDEAWERAQAAISKALGASNV